MTLASQHRLCRAGIIVGALLCMVALFDVITGLMGMFREFSEAERESLQDPESAGQVAGEVVATIIARLWPLPLGLLFLTLSLLGLRPLRRKARALP